MRTGVALVFFVFVSCQPVETIETQYADPPVSVWSIDLVYTTPGLQSEYLDNIRNNWAQARAIGTNRGELISYRALAAPQDSSRDWDVLLMTEYRDSTAWADREAIFSDIFKSDDFEAVPMGMPSDSVRAFFEGGVTLTTITESRSN